jgi:hypothetical protein
MRRYAILLTLLLTAALPLHAGLFDWLFGKSKQPPPGWALKKESAKIEGVSFAGALQPCTNWAWAAGVTAMAATRGARLDQQDLVYRLYGGGRCLSDPGDFEALARQISHDYILSDGQKFALRAQYLPGAPTQADPLIMSVRQKRPMMVVWKSHIYLLTGLNWDEYQAPTGNKMFIVNELRFFDPLAPANPDVIFSRDRDNPGDLNGVFDLVVTPN